MCLNQQMNNICFSFISFSILTSVPTNARSIQCSEIGERDVDAIMGLTLSLIVSVLNITRPIIVIGNLEPIATFTHS